MSPPHVVIDTCTLTAALRSRRGASFKALSLVGKGYFEIYLSVPLVVDYEAVGVRHLAETGLEKADVDAIIDTLCLAGHRRRIHFLWRPFLKDPGDDMVLELAVEANCQYIVTFNLRAFKGSEQFGVLALTPRHFLKAIGVIQ